MLVLSWGTWVEYVLWYMLVLGWGNWVECALGYVVVLGWGNWVEYVAGFLLVDGWGNLVEFDVGYMLVFSWRKCVEYVLGYMVVLGWGNCVEYVLGYLCILSSSIVAVYGWRSFVCTTAVTIALLSSVCPDKECSECNDVHIASELCEWDALGSVCDISLAEAWPFVEKCGRKKYHVNFIHDDIYDGNNHVTWLNYW